MNKSYRQTLYETHGPDLDPDAASKILTLTWLERFDSSTKPILMELCETDNDQFLSELIEQDLVDKRYVAEVLDEIYFLTEKGQNGLTEHLSALAS